MTGLGESVGITTKGLEVLKELPLWILVGLSIASGILLFMPGIPVGARLWIRMGGVVFLSLAVARAISVLIKAIPEWRSSVDARRRFHLTAIPQQGHWSSSKQVDDSIVTQVAAHFLVKNRTANALALVRVKLIAPHIHGEILYEDISVRGVHRNVYGNAADSGHTVPPGMSLPGSATIMIRGVTRKKVGRDVRVTLAVSDDEGQEQRTTFNMRVIQSPSTIGISSSLEVVSSISDPIEREIAGVLQAELGRYDKCGRTCGGLGSIHMVVNGLEMIGVGGDVSNSNSPKNLSISDNPDASELRSDNLEALMAYYKRLANPTEQGKFGSALLARINGKDYLRVTYFIVCVLWKIGRLREALEKAKVSLPQGEIKAFGISNTLMLLNGLLRHRHTDFTNTMLDDIEQLLIGLNEHPFQIPEKIAAIRTLRLMGPENIVVI